MPARWSGEKVRKILDKYVVKKGMGYPDSLVGHILLEEGDFGYIIVEPEVLAEVLNMRDDPALRPPELKNLDEDGFEQETGYSFYLKRWRREGINI